MAGWFYCKFTNPAVELRVRRQRVLREVRWTDGPTVDNTHLVLYNEWP